MEAEFSVLSLNIWGLPWTLSKKKQLRIQAIAHYLSESRYDAVCLQELWCAQDFAIIRSECLENLPFAQYFPSGVFGSGLAIFSKWPIIKTYYCRWNLNGYVHMIHHGDWFGGKGVALAQLAVGNMSVNVYNTHLIARYDSLDCYEVHRIAQAFDTGQFIDLTSRSADFSVLCGDLNSECEDICVRLITSVADLEDAYDEARDPREKVGYGTFGSTTNSFTKIQDTSGENMDRGERIDYILYRANGRNTMTTSLYDLPIIDHIPGTNCNYSDHEAVEARFHLTSNPQLGRPVRKFPFTRSVTAIEEALELVEYGIKQISQDRTSRLLISLALLFLIYCYSCIYTNNLTIIFQLVGIPVCMYVLYLSTIWYQLEMNALKSTQLQMKTFLKTRLALGELFNEHAMAGLIDAEVYPRYVRIPAGDPRFMQLCLTIHKDVG